MNDKHLGYIARVHGCSPSYFNYGQTFHKTFPVRNEDEKVFPYKSDTDLHFLVNKDNFELLEWVPSSNGNVPPLAVQTCKDVYIARTEDGIGVILKNGRKRMHVPGTNPTHYEVLTLNHDIESQFLNQAQYTIKKDDVLSQTQVLRHFVAENNACRAVTQQVVLEKSIETITKWDIGAALTVGMKIEGSLKIPFLADYGMSFSGEISLSGTYGQSNSEKTTHSIKIDLQVQPNEYCDMKILANTFSTNIPFTAVLTRTYKNKEVRITTISGTYTAQEVGEIKGIVERCKPLNSRVRCLIV